MSVSWIKYIPHHQVEEYKSLGWTIKEEAFQNTHHGQHAVLGIWKGLDDEASPPMPAVWAGE